jgi:hypothetical protein
MISADAAHAYFKSESKFTDAVGPDPGHQLHLAAPP